MDSFKKYISSEAKGPPPRDNKSRASFYMEYYKNLSPKNFIITRDRDTISIKIKKR